jgi:hypothetical protein
MIVDISGIKVGISEIQIEVLETKSKTNTLVTSKGASMSLAL